MEVFLRNALTSSNVFDNGLFEDALKDYKNGDTLHEQLFLAVIRLELPVEDPRRQAVNETTVFRATIREWTAFLQPFFEEAIPGGDSHSQIIPPVSFCDQAQDLLPPRLFLALLQEVPPQSVSRFEEASRLVPFVARLLEPSIPRALIPLSIACANALLTSILPTLVAQMNIDSLLWDAVLRILMAGICTQESLRCILEFILPASPFEKRCRRGGELLIFVARELSYDLAGGPAQTPAVSLESSDAESPSTEEVILESFNLEPKFDRIPVLVSALCRIIELLSIESICFLRLIVPIVLELSEHLNASTRALALNLISQLFDKCKSRVRAYQPILDRAFDLLQSDGHDVQYFRSTLTTIRSSSTA
jgi:hypothetical protein